MRSEDSVASLGRYSKDRPVGLTAARDHEGTESMTNALPASADPATLTDRQLQALIASPEAHCTNRSIDPDDWFPVTSNLAKARSQASRAIALCVCCPVRAQCLELSLRLWDGAGRHGIWGGTLEPERQALRRQWLAGISVRDFMLLALGEHRSIG
jgi:hypothetical protein